MDGGWEAIHIVYGKILTPYILNFVQNQDLFHVDLNLELHKLVVDK